MLIPLLLQEKLPNKATEVFNIVIKRFSRDDIIDFCEKRTETPYGIVKSIIEDITNHTLQPGHFLISAILMHFDFLYDWRKLPKTLYVSILSRIESNRIVFLS